MGAVRIASLHVTCILIGMTMTSNVGFERAFRLEAQENPAPPAQKKSVDDLRASVGANNSFGLHLYHTLRRRDGNLFVSPFSVGTMLAVVYGGAAGETKQEIARVLSIASQGGQADSGLIMLNRSLNRHSKGVDVTSANCVWLRGDDPLDAAFSSRLKDFDTGLGRADFAGDPDGARTAINEWIGLHTNRKIKSLIPPGALNQLTEFVLANAIYLHADWRTPFDQRKTARLAYHISSTRQEHANTMQKTAVFDYAETGTVQILELPYNDPGLSMLILLPRTIDGLPALEGELTPKNLQKWTGALHRQQVEVFLPKFRFASQFELAPALREMGMSEAFSERADFSGVFSSRKPIAISQVLHETFADVNEFGTEAAAATGAVAVGSGARLGQPVVFRADRPFLFLIRDRRFEDAILFLGRLVDPRS